MKFITECFRDFQMNAKISKKFSLNFVRRETFSEMSMSSHLMYFEHTCVTFQAIRTL